jgi:hypothetical protein
MGKVGATLCADKGAIDSPMNGDFRLEHAAAGGDLRSGIVRRELAANSMPMLASAGAVH